MKEYLKNPETRKRIAYGTLFFSVIQIALYYEDFSGALYGKENLYSFSFSFSGIVIMAPQSILVLGISIYATISNMPKNSIIVWSVTFILGSAWSILAYHNMS